MVNEKTKVTLHQYKQCVIQKHFRKYEDFTYQW